MENLPSIDEILSNQYFQVGMIVWVVFFSGCITRMVPDNLRRLLDNPVVKVGVLALVVYLAEKDFKLAVVVAAGFFLSTAPLDIKEGMACTSSTEMLPACLHTNEIPYVQDCGANCQSEGLLSTCKKNCSLATCQSDCDGAQGDDTQCKWNSTANNGAGVCHKICSTITDQNNCTTPCSWDPQANNGNGACQSS